MQSSAEDNSQNIPYLKQANIISDILNHKNPYLNHFLQKFDLKDTEVLTLALLIVHTDQMQKIIKTTYSAISEGTELTSMEVYRALQTLHRYRIIDYRPDGKYVLISFFEITEEIAEIDLARKHDKQISKLRVDVNDIQSKDFVLNNELFDAIYPIMGKLVSKKISESLKDLVYYINERLNSALDMQIWQMRVRSFFSGVSVGELLLRKSLPFYVQEIFLLEKESGLLLAHASREIEAVVDKDMIGGMLNAINEFIKTSFQHRGGETVNEIQYGDFRILINDYSRFYTAAVVYGLPNPEFNSQLENLSHFISKKFATKLKNFQGDMDSLTGINPLLEEFIRSFTQKLEEKPKEINLRKIKILGYSLVVLLLTFSFFRMFILYQDMQIEKQATAILKKEIPVHTANVRLNSSWKTLRIEGLVSRAEIAVQITEKLKKKIPHIKSIDNRMIEVNLVNLVEFGSTLQEIRKELSLVRFAQIKEFIEPVTIPLSSIGKPTEEEIRFIKQVAKWIKYTPAIHVDIAVFPFLDYQKETNDADYETKKKTYEQYANFTFELLISEGIKPNRLRIILHSQKMNNVFLKYRTVNGLKLIPRLTVID